MIPVLRTIQDLLILSAHLQVADNKALQPASAALFQAGCMWVRHIAKGTAGMRVPKAELHAQIVSPISACMKLVGQEDPLHGQLAALQKDAIGYIDHHKEIARSFDAAARRDLAIMFGDLLTEAA